MYERRVDSSGLIFSLLSHRHSCVGLVFFTLLIHNKQIFLNFIPEELDQFRFLRAACYANIKGSVGLILVKLRTSGFLYRLICHLDRLYHYRVSFVRDGLFHIQLLALFFSPWFSV